MFNNRLNEEIVDLQINNRVLLEQLDQSKLTIQRLQDQNCKLSKKIYEDKRSASVVIDWATINALSVIRCSSNLSGEYTKVIFRDSNGMLDNLNIDCNDLLHEELCDEFISYLDARDE